MNWEVYILKIGDSFENKIESDRMNQTQDDYLTDMRKTGYFTDR